MAFTPFAKQAASLSGKTDSESWQTTVSEGNSLLALLDHSFAFEYFFGEQERLWKAHSDREWRILPYTAIACVGECDPHYTAFTQHTGPIALKRNACIVFPAGMPFKLTLCGEAYLSNGHMAFTVLGHVDVLSLFDIKPLIDDDRAIEMRALLDVLATCAGADKEDSGTAIITLIHMKQAAFRLLRLLIDGAPLRPEQLKQLGDITRISAALTCISSHMDKALTREHLAALTSLSPTRFHYVFKAIMGMPPMAYLAQQRLRTAQHLLLTSDHTITDIAAKIGMPSIYHFSKRFKAAFGLSPLQYRALHRQRLQE